jgi:hypothetical protein
VTARKMPRQHRWRSVQEVATPPELLASVVDLVGAPIAWDLAANADNYVTADARYLGPGSKRGADALAVQWHRLPGASGQLLWLNPPFGDIAPWAAKCAAEAWLGASIAMLAPASVGADWFEAYVLGKAEVLALRPRITFVGHRDPYPKDCMIALYRPGAIVAPKRKFLTWRWKGDAAA